MDDDELDALREDSQDAYWDHYNRLSFRAKIRQGGVVHWLSSTNVGVIVGIALAFIAAWLLYAVPHWIEKHGLSQTALSVLGFVVIAVALVAMIRSAIRVIRGD